MVLNVKKIDLPFVENQIPWHVGVWGCCWLSHYLIWSALLIFQQKLRQSVCCSFYCCFILFSFLCRKGLIEEYLYHGETDRQQNIMEILDLKRVLVKFRIRVLFGRMQRKVVISCHAGNEDSTPLASNLIPFYSIKADEGGTWDLALQGGRQEWC